jgi:N-acetylneuraminic acid mutarotase
LPDFPGAARQGLSSAVVGNALYFWGGFSYTDPYCYDDGWTLTKQSGVWQWIRLPPFPWRITTTALTSVDTKIYAFGGADYDAAAFYTESDRSGKVQRLGARLLVLDTANLKIGWKELPECPGTPRWVHAFAAVAGKLYVIGGASGDTVIDGVRYGYCTIVDNWKFDLATEKWSRISDLPISSGNFPRSSCAVYENRYIILPGGHQYDYVLGPDGKVRKKYGSASRANPTSGLHNDVFVYDTVRGEFGVPILCPLTTTYR